MSPVLQVIIAIAILTMLVLIYRKVSVQIENPTFPVTPETPKMDIAFVAFTNVMIDMIPLIIAEQQDLTSETLNDQEKLESLYTIIYSEILAELTDRAEAGDIKSESVLKLLNVVPAEIIIETIANYSLRLITEIINARSNMSSPDEEVVVQEYASRSNASIEDLMHECKGCDNDCHCHEE